MRCFKCFPVVVTEVVRRVGTRAVCEKLTLDEALNEG